MAGSLSFCVVVNRPMVSTVRPMNRVPLYEEFSGEVHDLFRGFIENWD